MIKKKKGRKSKDYPENIFRGITEYAPERGTFATSAEAVENALRKSMSEFPETPTVKKVKTKKGIRYKAYMPAHY